MQLFGWFGKKQKIGTQAAVIINPAELPEKRFVVQVDEDLCKKFDEHRIKESGLAAALDQLALQWGAMEIEKNATWKEMRERYNLNSKKSYSYNYETGRLSVFDGNDGEETMTCQPG